MGRWWNWFAGAKIISVICFALYKYIKKKDEVTGVMWVTNYWHIWLLIHASNFLLLSWKIVWVFSTSSLRCKHIPYLGDFTLGGRLSCIAKKRNGRDRTKRYANFNCSFLNKASFVIEEKLKEFRQIWLFGKKKSNSAMHYSFFKVLLGHDSSQSRNGSSSSQYA